MRPFGRGRSVKRMESKGDLDGLVAAVRAEPGRNGSDGRLKPSAVKMRIRALGALGRLYGPRVEEGVRSGLADPSPEVRLAAVEAAATANLTGAANGLVAGLVYWDEPAFEGARAAAGRVLHQWELPDLPERVGVVLAQNGSRELEDDHMLLLRTLMHNDSREIGACREAVGAQLVAFLAEPDVSMVDAERTGVLLAALDGGGVGPLADVIWSSDPALSALHVAAQLRDNRLLEPLVAAYGHDERSVRELAVRALGAIQDSRGVGVLLHATRDPDFTVRQAANESLESMGVAAVIFGLAATIKPELTQEASPAFGEQLEPGPREGED